MIPCLLVLAVLGSLVSPGCGQIEEELSSRLPQSSDPCLIPCLLVLTVLGLLVYKFIIFYFTPLSTFVQLVKQMQKEGEYIITVLSL